MILLNFSFFLFFYLSNFHINSKQFICEKEFDTQLKKYIYTQVDQRPQPPSNCKDFLDYLFKYFTISKEMRKLGLIGSVHGIFIIDENGYPLPIKYLGRYSENIKMQLAFNNMIKSMPKCLPAKCGNLNVTYKISLKMYIKTE
ncbi:MAG: hypothetical protein EAY69_08880 [Cytophagales bacterium]|nr:MAG: hypothetical protein EAY69_08880 [Cytophagales bacterium]